MPPSSAGYSGTPLPKKLGITEGIRFATKHAPDDFADPGADDSGADVSPRLRAIMRRHGIRDTEAVQRVWQHAVDVANDFGNRAGAAKQGEL